MKKWEKEGSSRRKGRKNNKKGRKQRGFYSRLLASFFELGMYRKDFKMYGTLRQYMYIGRNT